MKDTTLFNIERHQKILDIMHRDGSVNVNSLASFFQVTPATIRADLTRLEAQGALVRTHGGAIANVVNRREPRINERHNEEKKSRISEKAVEYVAEHDILLLDTGTTMVSFAKALVSSPICELTIFSNDIDVIRILEEKETFSLHLFAGKMRNGYHYCYCRMCGRTFLSDTLKRKFCSEGCAAIQRRITKKEYDEATRKDALDVVVQRHMQFWRNRINKARSITDFPQDLLQRVEQAFEQYKVDAKEQKRLAKQNNEISPAEFFYNWAYQQENIIRNLMAEYENPSRRKRD